MTPCKFCNKTHRAESAALACQVKAERAQARQDRKDKDVARRQANLDKVPVQEFVRKTRALGGAGGTWERIMSSLKKDYPESLGPWTLWKVVRLYAETLNWPVDLDTATEMLLERAVTGMYISLHPLELPDVRSTLYTHKVLSPEQVRLATGEDVAIQEDQR